MPCLQGVDMEFKEWIKQQNYRKDGTLGKVAKEAFMEWITMSDKLTLKFLPDDGIGLEDKEMLIKILRNNSSNLGDGRCLCGGCLAAWTIEHFVDHPDSKWIIKPGEVAIRDE